MAEDKTTSESLEYFKRLGTPIMAPATAPGGPVGVIRLSGKDLAPFASYLGPLPEAGRVLFRRLKEDEVLLLGFKAPASFTGEDVIEIQGHGISSVMGAIQSELEKRGALRALPGEFSFRAVLNGKMSLEKAEALQAAFSLEGLGASSASRLLSVDENAQNAVSTRLREAIDQLVLARGRLEAAIDFPEAEAEQATEVQGARKAVGRARASLQRLMTAYDTFSSAAGPPRIVICGPPNVGKSTLLNQLVGGPRALVSEMAGTTRDVIEARIRLPSGREVRLLDTAGLRDLPQSEVDTSEDRKIEAMGINAGRQILKSASLLIWVSRATKPVEIPEEFAHKRKLEVYSFADQAIGGQQDNAFNFNILTESGELDRFLRLCESALGYDEGGLASVDALVSRRQYSLLGSALSSIEAADGALKGLLPMEIGADELRTAERSLRQAVGEGLSDAYIGAIFSQFCLGK